MITMGQVTASVTATFVCNVPPGPGHLIITNNDSTSTAFGTSTSLTYTNGFLLEANSSIDVLLYQASPPMKLYAIKSSATGLVGYVVSTSG